MATPILASATRIEAGVERRSVYVEVACRSEVVSAWWLGVAGWSRELRLVPDGCTDITWDGSDLAVVPGAAAVRWVDVREDATSVGVRLHPAAAGPVLGRPAGTLSGPVRLADLWGRPARDALAEELADLPAEAAGATLCAAVERRARSGSGVDPAVVAAVADLASLGATIAGAAATSGYSARHVRRRFLDDVGLSPKSLQRVLRFRRALASLCTGSVADIAADHGFADQAHLTRDFRRHAAATPGRLARQLGRSECAPAPAGHGIAVG